MGLWAAAKHRLPNTGKKQQRRDDKGRSKTHRVVSHQRQEHVNARKKNHGGSMSRWAAKVISRGRLLRTPPFSSAGLHLSSPALSRGGKGQEPAGASERGAQHCPFKIELFIAQRLCHCRTAVRNSAGALHGVDTALTSPSAPPPQAVWQHLARQHCSHPGGRAGKHHTSPSSVGSPTRAGHTARRVCSARWVDGAVAFIKGRCTSIISHHAQSFNRRFEMDRSASVLFARRQVRQARTGPPLFPVICTAALFTF